MKRFSWGKVIDTFNFVIDGHELEIVKYHPWMREGCQIKTGTPNLEVIMKDDMTSIERLCVVGIFLGIAGALCGVCAVLIIVLK